MKKVKTLITGFEPFDGAEINPSWMAAKALPERMPDFNIIAVLLPVEFNKSFEILEKAIAEHEPDLVICTGLASNRSEICVERVAINIDDANIPDNSGNQPADQIIDYAAANAYFSNLPLKEIIRKVGEAGIKARISDSAGTFVCNHLMFRLMNLIYCSRPSLMGGFIHVPSCHELLAKSKSADAMDLSEITRALKIIIETCCHQLTNGKWHGVQRQVIPYRDCWPSEYEKIRNKLDTGLGRHAVRIDHIGSTSVPGLAAKDVIDIQITVDSLSPEVQHAMEKLGYQQAHNICNDHVPPGMTENSGEWQKWFFRPPQGQRPTNTHVRIDGRLNQRYPLLFRDFLRAHPRYAEAYARLKFRLAENLANARTYPDVKDPAVDLIYFAAEKWAAETGWKC